MAAWWNGRHAGLKLLWAVRLVRVRLPLPLQIIKGTNLVPLFYSSNSSNSIQPNTFLEESSHVYKFNSGLYTLLCTK